MSAEPIRRKAPAEPGGIATLKVKDEVDRLTRMRWSELQREALDVGLPLPTVREAKTLDELRLAVLERKLGAALGGG